MLSKSFHLFTKLESLLSTVAGAALLMMMLVVVYDIVGRTFGIWNLLSAVEQTTLYMMLLGFFGLSQCYRDGEHIVVDLATSGLSKRTVNRIDAFWAILTAILLLPLGYLVVVDGLGLHAYGRRSEILGISPLVHHAIGGLGLGMAALVALMIGLQNLTSPPPSSGVSQESP